MSKPAALSLPSLVAAPFWDDAARRPARRRHTGVAISVLLHLALLAVLLLRLQPAPPPSIEAQRSISVLLLGAPSPAPQAAPALPTPSRPAPPKPQRAKPKLAQKTAAPQTAAPVATPVVAAATPVPSPATTSTASSASLSTAAAVPDAVEPEVPPPLEYLRRIALIISRSQKYPWNARQYGHQGDAIVRVHLRRDGAVLRAALVRSSGHASLDAEAQDVVLRIARFPPFPADYIPHQREFDIDQPVTFRTYLN